MSLAYGYDLEDGDDFMTAPIQATEMVSRVVLPGAVLVNHLPFCAFPYFDVPMMLVTDSSFSATHSFMGSIPQL